MVLSIDWLDCRCKETLKLMAGRQVDIKVKPPTIETPKIDAFVTKKRDICRCWDIAREQNTPLISINKRISSSRVELIMIIRKKRIRV